MAPIDYKNSIKRIEKFVPIYDLMKSKELSMEKLRLIENMKSDFMEYAIERKNKYPLDRPILYLTSEILERTFDFFVAHRLTVESNAKSYWYKNNELQMECYGYSGRDINFRDDTDGIIENLYHEVWCKAEWVARGKNGWFAEVCKQYFGNQAYNKICA